MANSATLEHAVVQIISDDRASEREVTATLEGQGCLLHRAGPGLHLDTTMQCDVGVIAVQRNTGWSAGVITALRSSETACAAVVVLAMGGADDIGLSLRGGAVDCLVRPVSRTVLLESLANALACTLRWRGRLSAGAKATTTFGPAIPLTPNHSLVFEPVCAPQLVAHDTPQRIEAVVRRLAGQNQLTPREREVLYWLLQGHRYEDIATVLGIVPRTAKFHAANLLRKLELESRYELPRLLAEES